jgi:hypothetical protein
MIKHSQGQIFNVLEVARLVQRNEIDLDNSVLYSDSGVDHIDAKTKCYLGDYPSITESDEEVFPDFVSERNLDVLYYGQQFTDVVRNAVSQLGEPSDDDYVSALNYYSDHDNFLTFQS